jgi:hypothetical protein
MSRRNLQYLRAASLFPPADVQMGKSPLWRRSTVETWINRDAKTALRRLNKMRAEERSRERVASIADSS